jgi:hypothetical protein
MVEQTIGRISLFTSSGSAISGLHEMEINYSLRRRRFSLDRGPFKA